MIAMKNTPAKGGTMLKMNSDTYTMRRKVMDVLYEIKSKGFTLPRVEVRIVETNGLYTASAKTGYNIIHIGQHVFTDDHCQRFFRQIILHEIVHAVFGVGEVKGCRLMHCSEFWNIKPTEQEAWDIFSNYYNQYK